MFTAEERARIRDELIAVARIDDEVIAAALAGSTARGEEDEWSDLDLLLQLTETADEHATVQRWTRHIDETYGVADTFDVMSDGVRYRVFLLHSSLQLDISFWPHDQFRGTGEPLQIVYGTANSTSTSPRPEPNDLIGMGWLCALHARSALARGRPWQAVMMLDDLRNHVIALACLRHGLNPWQGRGVDRLPRDARQMLLDSRASSVSRDELGRSKQLLVDLLLTETRHHDARKADSLKAALAHL